MTDASALLERFMLALCVYREARGETPRGRRLVACTVTNRWRDGLHRWPGTVAGVVTQPKQFSSFNASDPNVTRFPFPGPVWDDCVAAADDALDPARPPLTDANHYHVIGLAPAWRDDTKVVATEGHHVFYQL